MFLTFDTKNQDIFHEKVDVDFYLDMDPLMNEIYDVLIEELCNSKTFKAGHLFKMAFAICAYIMKNKHPEEHFAEIKELLDNHVVIEIRNLILVVVRFLLVLYRSPDNTTDEKIRRIIRLIENARWECDTTSIHLLESLTIHYADKRKYANLDFKSHEDFIIAMDVPPNVSAISEEASEVQKCIMMAQKRILFLSGTSPKTHLAFMKPEEYDNFCNYVKYFIAYGEIPNDIQKINARVNDKRYLSYAFHQIYDDLKTSSIKHFAKEWVELLFAIFSNFDNMKEETYIRKFSEKPNDFDKTIALIKESLPEKNEVRAC